eukprot:TRINITY_DN78788_c0_g1_i1.p1 TRINITY_DN78788_c0_g1~~TRINITY_DN78788_c0_g1_i1.p1  ORF type:complete len:121 (-),score=16.18 TRINITY_DN78788_c0_g1_i1:63-383(-)
MVPQLFLVALTISFVVPMEIQKSPPPPDTSCPWVGLDCLFNDISVTGNIQTWQDCAAACAAHKTCAYWSWRGPTAWMNPYGCWLKSGCTQVISDPSMVSGAYTCIA